MRHSMITLHVPLSRYVFWNGLLHGNCRVAVFARMSDENSDGWRAWIKTVAFDEPATPDVRRKTSSYTKSFTREGQHVVDEPEV